MNFQSKNIIDFENGLPFMGQIFLEFLKFQPGGVYDSFDPFSHFKTSKTPT